MTELIEIENLSFRPAALASEKPDILRGVTLSIEQGSFVAIIGKNGSGKTTLIKLINGLLLPTMGTVRVDGLDTQHSGNRQRLRSLVGMVFQNPDDQIVASTVEEDVAFGLENDNLPTQEIRRRVFEQLEAAELTTEASHPPHFLSGGQIQKLALAGVLARKPKIILFDEPTSMLDPRSRKQFLRYICKLNEQGMTVIYVTHHMEETVFADKIVALMDGQIVLQGSPEIFFSRKFTLYEIGLDIPETVVIANRFRRLGWKIAEDILTPEDLIKVLPIYKGSFSGSSPSPQKENNKPLIRLADVHYTYLAGTPLAKQALQGASLNVISNRMHGIAGTNGSGKSTLLQHINGILRPSQGHIEVNSFVLEDPDILLRDVINQVGLVFQNPETQFFEVFVGDEIAYGPKQFRMDNIRERVHQAMSLVGLDFMAYKDRRLETLSGGEKRKVALASTLILDQEILLFDEPTAGMDPRARDDLLTLLQKLSQEGKTIVIASHRLEELAQVTQDLSFMKTGIVLQTAATHTLISDPELIAKAGLEPPLAVKISHRLIEKGWPIQGKMTHTPCHLLSALHEVIA